MLARLTGLLLLICAALAPLSPALAQEAAAEPAAAEAPPAGYAELADILEDEASRQALIDTLRQLAAPAGEGVAEGDPAALEAAAKAEAASLSPEPSLARRVAALTKGFAEGAVDQATAVWRGLADMADGDGRDFFSGMATWAGELAIVVGVTLVLFFVLRRLVAAVYGRADRWVLASPEGGRRWVRRTLAIAGAALLDVGVVLLAWVAGYLLALTVLGDQGRMNTAQSLFLNAFLIIEIVKTGLRGLFAGRFAGLRILPLGDEDAAYWNTWLARMVGFIGYGMLTAVPIVNAQVSLAAGRATAVLIMVLAFVYALMVILQNRRRVRDSLTARADRSGSGFVRAVLRLLARSWHIFAIGYFAALAFVTVVRPGDALPFMAASTLQSLLAVAGGFIVSALLERLITLGIRVPEDTRRNLPNLEKRLNAYVPTGLRVVRIVVLVGVLALIADAWDLWDLAAWAESERGSGLIGAFFDVALIIVLSVAVWIAVASWVEHRLSPETGTGEPGAREKTLLSIFRNAFSIVLITMTAMIVLSEIGIDIGPLIAGAGVLGLAIGFGSQKLVQDIITGVFIQLENAMNAGDVVTAGGITGTVEKLTIRSIGVRDLAGSYHIIPFSSVDMVTNFMRDFAYHVGEYGIAYRENIDDAIEHLKAAFEELRADPANGALILDDLEVHGVTALADSSVNIRVRIKTAPGSQWALGRAYNRLVKKHFDAAGIEIPFPHMTLYFGQDKDGSAPPVPLPAPLLPKAAE
ncbi:mechanosensitive channel protein [Caenispirillum bisanense]|uniref:Small conductance mechanosensitive channel n=1 Tax=Caenispirillum bisanense TaxID=414052 RepID=A0A286GSZ7_9PROT|nr:mechanosensitive channel protein [Caenispirillum bisanense]SOD98094.1 small conductance mechanosensitive channel [Caenispirillum bisanense]